MQQSIQEKIGWKDNKSLFESGIVVERNRNLVKSVSNTIINYVEGQIKDFLKENHISQKRWFKHGVIAEYPDEIACKSYILYYKTPFRKLKRKITIEYNFIL